MKKIIFESEWLYGGQCAVPYFFAVNFVHQYLMGGAGGKFSMLPAMSPMVGWLVVHYPYQRMAR